MTSEQKPTYSHLHLPRGRRAMHADANDLSALDNFRQATRRVAQPPAAALGARGVVV